MEEYLLGISAGGDLIQRLFDHPNSQIITKARILEIPTHKYGLPEMRDAYIRSGQSNWLAWAACVGSRHLKPAARNYPLGYAANASPINRLIAEIVRKVPDDPI